MLKKIVFTILFVCGYVNALEIDILYLEQKIKKPPSLSNVIEEPKDSGIKGAQIAIKDSNKSARFLNQKYILIEEKSKDINKLIKSFENFVKKGGVFVILNVSDELLEKISNNKLAEKTILFNSTNPSSKFRKTQCKQNLLHTISSNAMLYDALVQFLVKRNWKKWLLLKGSKKEDKKIEKAIKRAAKRFGGKIVEEKIWSFDTDIRRKAQSEMPSFTQSKEHDVVLVADYFNDFGEYVYFNTWIPRPVAGTSGLRPVTWHKVIEAWGAAQMQKRFEKKAKRWMNSKDYASWVAVRTIVTSVKTTNTMDFETNLKNIYSEDFSVAAYKGRKLTFRKFNGQLRMPVSLVHPKALVSNSPQVGFLHQKTDLDTLGIASFEVKCK
ncbi:MAG: ABC transporter substrate-binding protein [Arcobacter sp.]|nr:ABC transporter substrate-binding protein [Arcobacter sp.]